MSNFHNIPIKEKIRLIKYNRFNGNERCLINTIDDVIKYQLEDRIRWYSKDGNKLLFELFPPTILIKKSTLYVDYHYIWEFYSECLGLDYLTIYNLIRKIVPEYLNIKEDFILKVEKPQYTTMNYISY